MKVYRRNEGIQYRPFYSYMIHLENKWQTHCVVSKQKLPKATNHALRED